jgi:hypothetical protein
MNEIERFLSNNFVMSEKSSTFAAQNKNNKFNPIKIRIMKSNVNEQTLKAYAINIQWDTDGEEVNLPERVEIPFNVSDDEIADMLSDEYGFCVFGFDIEQVEE